MTPFKKIVFLFLCSSLFFACSSKNKQPSKYSAQKSVAEYVEQATFTTLEGKKISVSDFKGKVVLIDFWETWCGPCLASFPTLQKLQKEYSKNFVVLAVTPGFSNTKKEAIAFKKSHEYDFIYAMDTNNLHRKLNVRAIPYKVFVSAEGEFIKTVRGTSGPRQDYKKIKAIIEKYSRAGNPAKNKTAKS